MIGTALRGAEDRGTRPAGWITMKLPKTRMTLLRQGSRLQAVGRIILLAGAVGVAAGVGAILFDWLCHGVSHWALDWAAGYREAAPSGESTLDRLLPPTTRPLTPWLLLVVPAIGGLLAGLLIHFFAREAAGPGAGMAIDAYHNRNGRIGGEVGVVKILASALTLGTGGSGGREGPIALVGAGFGSYLARKFRLSRQDRRVLLVAGMAAGIAALFRAPLAGAIFAVEVLYADPDFETGSLLPAFFAATVAYCVYASVFGAAPVFAVAHMEKFNRPLVLLPLTALTLVAVGAGFLFARSLRGSQWLFGRLGVPAWLKPCIGGLGAGAVAVAIYVVMIPSARHDALGVLAYGYGFFQKVLAPGAAALRTQADGSVPMIVMLLMVVALGKMVTTSLTIGSGGSAGVFGPSIVIGGSVGAVVGLAFQEIMPSVVTRIDVFAILGAAAFFSAAANTPVSTLIMVSEMTGTFALFLPAMWVCALAYLLSRGWSLYSQQVACRTESPAHRGELIVDVLADLTVQDAWIPGDEEILTIPHDMMLDIVAVKVSAVRQTCFPVVDDEGKLAGYFGLVDIRYFLFDPEAGKMVAASAVAATDVEPVTPLTDLSDVMGRFAQCSYQELPIVAPERPGIVIGLLRRQDVITLYNTRIAESQSPGA